MSRDPHRGACLTVPDPSICACLAAQAATALEATHREVAEAGAALATTRQEQQQVTTHSLRTPIETGFEHLFWLRSMGLSGVWAVAAAHSARCSAKLL
jgi:hypothetical protein